MYRFPRILLVALAVSSAMALAGCGPASQASPAAVTDGPSHPGVDAVFADLDRDGPGAAEA